MGCELEVPPSVAALVVGVVVVGGLVVCELDSGREHLV